MSAIGDVLKKSKKVVIKIGSNVLSDENGYVNIDNIGNIVDQIMALIEDNKKVIIVSSGAGACGMATIKKWARHKDVNYKQALCAIGQVELMMAYKQCFEKYGVHVAQILLTNEDFSDPDRTLHIRNTIYTLEDENVVPIINENDTVAVDEIKIGDNDTLSALVATLWDADALVMLSNIEGIFTDDPGAAERGVAGRLVVAGEERKRFREGRREGRETVPHQKGRVAAADQDMDAGLREAVVAQRRLEGLPPLPGPVFRVPPGNRLEVGGRRVTPLSREVVRRHPADRAVVRGTDDAAAPRRRPVRLAEQDARNGAPLQLAEDLPVVDVADDREGALPAPLVFEDERESVLVAQSHDIQESAIARLAQHAFREAALLFVAAGHKEDPGGVLVGFIAFHGA